MNEFRLQLNPFEYLAAAFGRATPRTCAEHYPYITTYHTGLLEQWIEYDLAGRFNPYGLAHDYQAAFSMKSTCTASKGNSI